MELAVVNTILRFSVLPADSSSNLPRFFGVAVSFFNPFKKIRYWCELNHSHIDFMECMGLKGLTENEWVERLTEASSWASGYELRRLFATLLVHCQVVDPAKLWTLHYVLSEDIAIMQRKKYKANNLRSTDAHIEACTLFEIESMMLKMGKSLKDISGMPLPKLATHLKIG